MKERPVLFSAPMVRAILEGRKTMTRRVVKLRHGADVVVTNGQVWKPARVDYAGYVDCPYGQVGDRLWVRENFCPIYPQDPHYNGGRPIEYDYQATYQHGDRLGDLIGEKKKWKPSIHMPRIASRILLEITGIRVERLQDISEADAIAEGARHFPDIPMGAPSAHPNRWSMEEPTDADQCLSTARYAFANLFCKVNGRGRGDNIDLSPWDANPLVWVIEFRRAA